ncbi:unnamed protein product (macronuclear) [Paramecium tetraurelia]|uniref:Uncharacterized protein n=1 Tax=Paramecium tetraurelia TaxID=5888 RepID=A0BNE5_PARTE|nr:uncharacterized protein GSPATT00030700001 [Paramecium tetraurelia]CAK60062.1 unnamed protein product [Paramecium tetraurelia]|eukprot:XP_001427460.1 hypothetical protein (macronuclear) [Paramecium tetraurelia strain d4-2]
MSNQPNKDFQEIEGKKKLFMKWALNTMRKYFNDKNLPYHLLSTCVSIKPGTANRRATLQSYPNQGVWKHLGSLPENVREDLKAFLIESAKSVETKFQQFILIEFQKRVQNEFDFLSFYKESKETKDNQVIQFQTNIDNETNETPQIQADEKEKQVKQKKWSKGQDFVSESKQILIQMQICNTQAPIVPVNQLHYHKLRTLLEKIKELKCKMSDEMKQFQFELEKFCKQDFCSTEPAQKKKVKKNTENNEQNDIQEKTQYNFSIKVENEDYDLLSSFKERVKRIEPGITLFIPNSQQFEEPTRSYLQQFEDNYYKELYYKEKAEQMELNPKNILQLWRSSYQIVQYKISQQKVEAQSDRSEFSF